MIRERGPVLLIPAAWALTLATVIYPGVDMYWIEHMHYFMLIFLTGFTVFSWKQMGENPVLDIWRKIIAGGILFTGLGALSFNLNPYSTLLAGSSLAYWFLAPAAGLYASSQEMKEYSDTYQDLAILSAASLLIFIAGLATSQPIIAGLSLALVAAAQTYSMLIAAKLD